jgi:hypothetical protein
MIDHPHPGRKSNLVFPPDPPCIRKRLLRGKGNSGNIMPWGHYFVPGDTGIFDRVGGGVGTELDAESVAGFFCAEERLCVVSVESG